MQLAALVEPFSVKYVHPYPRPFFRRVAGMFVLTSDNFLATCCRSGSIQERASLPGLRLRHPFWRESNHHKYMEWEVQVLSANTCTVT